ncbi:MAG: hypothetical protein ACRD4S_01635 [Candidatus Acidiferrales bacterium]
MAASHSISHVVPFPQPIPAVEKITQAELSHFVIVRNTLELLRDETEAIERDLLARLDSGAAVQSGIHIAEVKENIRRSPSWKEIVKRLAQRLDLDPDAYCSNVIAHTKPTRTVSLIVK